MADATPYNRRDFLEFTLPAIGYIFYIPIIVTLFATILSFVGAAFGILSFLYQAVLFVPSGDWHEFSVYRFFYLAECAFDDDSDFNYCASNYHLALQHYYDFTLNLTRLRGFNIILNWILDLHFALAFIIFTFLFAALLSISFVGMVWWGLLAQNIRKANEM